MVEENPSRCAVIADRCLRSQPLKAVQEGLIALSLWERVG